MYEENHIIKDARVLTEGFIPREVVHRDGQLKTIRDNLRPVLKGLAHRNSFLFGSPGTGKTCMARYVAEELSSYSASIANSYVNCWECNSRFKVLYTILQKLGMSLAVHRKGTPTDELMEVLRNKLKGRHCTIILDEVDQLEDDKILYDLTLIPNISLILISNQETALASADPRIRSRMASADNIEFPLYKTQELVDILSFRAEWGLLPGVVKKAQLERIAEQARGDARVAINALRVAAEGAENQDLEKVTDGFIDKAMPRAATVNVDKNLERLNPYQRLILEILKDRKNLDSGNLLKEFRSRVSERGLEPIVDRTFRKYMDKMVQYGFVSPSGDGRWRSYSLQ